MTKTNELPWQNGWNETKFFEAIQKENGWTYALSDNSLACVYRTETGNKCMVGVFIPDNIYTSKMDASENPMAASIIAEFNLEVYMPLPASLMQQIQQIHDNAAFKDINHEDQFKTLFIKEFNKLKKEYNHVN